MPDKNSVQQWCCLTIVLSLLVVAPRTKAEAAFMLVSEMAKESTADGRWHVQGWRDYDVSFYPWTEVYNNFSATSAAGTKARLTVPLGTSMPAGTYDLWVAMATQGTNLLLDASAGNVKLPAIQYAAKTWHNMGRFSSGQSFTNVLIEATKLQPLGKQQLVWFAGLGVVPTNAVWLRDGSDRIAELNTITTRNTGTISSGNLIPNSSFEFGLDSYGWTSGRDGRPGFEPWLSNMTASNGFHGAQSVAIGDGPGKSRYSVTTPAVWLRGDNTERQYTLSFYAKREGSLTMKVEWGMGFAGVQGVFTNATSSWMVTPSATWTRYQTTFWLKPYPNRVFYTRWSHVGSGATAYLDAVQLEEGAGARPYSPADAIECSLTVNRNGNLLNITDRRDVTVELFNSTSVSTNGVFNFEAFDWMNRKIAGGQTSRLIPAGYSTMQLSLATTNTGLTRMFGWLDGSPTFRSELVFSVVPLATKAVLETNSLFGVHGPANSSVVASNLQWGISWQRGLSPGGIIEWDVIEPTEGNFVWGTMDARINSWTNAAIIFANISDPNDIPAWAVTNGVPRLDRLSNFVFRAVSRYKNRIRYWEDLNEPAKYQPVSFARMLETTVSSVKAADPNAYFVAFGGLAEGYGTDWGRTVWDLLTEQAKSRIDAVSVHEYPSKQPWMSLHDNSDIEGAVQFGVYCAGKPVWNTETGVWQWGDYKGDRTGGLQGVGGYLSHSEEFNYRRPVWQNPSLLARNWIRCFGSGMKRYFFYDGRLTSYSMVQENTNPTWFNYDDSLNGVGVAYLWSKHFIDLPESITNPKNVRQDVLAFVFGRAKSSTLTAFSLSLSNYTATVTNGAFAVYDLHGNLLQSNRTTVAIGRIPTYWVSSTLSAAQLKQIFESANIILRSDTTPPAISIDVTPHGLATEKQLPLRFRWTAVDDWMVNDDDTPNLVLTRWRLGGGLNDWSDWSPKRYVSIASIPTVSTFIEIQAKDATGNASAVFAGPSFGPSSGENPIGPPSNLKIVAF